MWGPNANIWNTITSTGTLTPGATVGTLSSLFGASALTDVAGVAQDALPSAAGTAAASSVDSAAAGRGLIATGTAGIVGKLSVPPAWTAAAPAAGPLHSALGGTPMVAPPPVGAAGLPGVPMSNLPGHQFGRAVPQYGLRPHFVVRSPAAG